MLVFGLPISWLCWTEIHTKARLALEVARLPSSSLPPWIPGVVGRGICLQGKAVEAKVAGMKANWATLVENEMHSLFHCGQQCQAILSSWFITAFRQQSRNFLFPLKCLAESLLLSKMLLKHCANHSVLNQIPVWVVLFLSNLQIGGFGFVSCNSRCSETTLGKYKAPSQKILSALFWRAF